MNRSLTALNAKRGRNAGRRVSHILIEYSGPSFSDLPNSILENIVLRLSIKRIFVCKCVCKTWCHLISDPMFAKLHFNQAEVYPLIRSSGVTFLSRMLYLVQPEPEDFEHKLDICDHFYDAKYGCLCQVKVTLDTKLKLPLCNLDKILNERDGGHDMLNSEIGEQSNGCIKLKMKDHKYNVVNSCNGLLCLSEQSDNDPVIVCNPITGEFINLPENKTAKHPELRHIDCGFGFSPMSNQYKVIRMFLLMNQDDIRIMHRIVAEVHVLGTKSWENIGFYPYSTHKLLFPTYLNGCIHWFSEHDLISFDIETERFGSVPLPPLTDNYQFDSVAMGVLWGKICITDFPPLTDNIDCWAMNSAGNCWWKLFRIRVYASFRNWPHGSYQPIKVMNNGAILMFHSGSNALLYMDPRKDGYKYMKVCGMKSKLEAIPHIPSFVSLKDVLSGHDVEVLNVNSRCAELRLHNEAKTISLVAKKVKFLLNFVSR